MAPKVSNEDLIRDICQNNIDDVANFLVGNNLLQPGSTVTDIDIRERTLDAYKRSSNPRAFIHALANSVPVKHS